ncbi:MAG: late competence development ComFB family protein [Elainellaceae cyanobacterium]
MSIVQLINQALESGHLTAMMATDISRRCDIDAALALEDYMALDRLTDALMKGDVVTIPRKQFVNVMEELVLAEAAARITKLEANGPTFLDLGDVAAYALNRLPALYATTEEGMGYQRDRANEMLRGVIVDTVNEAITLSMAWPEFPDRQALQPEAQPSVAAQASTQLTSWLKTIVSAGKATVGSK